MSAIRKAKPAAKRGSRQDVADRRELDALSIDHCMRSLQKIEALLTALEFASNHECEFDVSDGLAGVITLIGQSLTALDTLGARHGN